MARFRNEEEMEALITTVIPTFERPVLVKRAVLSVLQQTCKDNIVLICDNSEKDETEKAVKEISDPNSRVGYFRHAKNVGSYNNFNFGIRNVKTPFFSLLSDDDILLPNFYERALEAFNRYPEAMFVCLAGMVINLKGDVLSEPVLANEEKLWSPGEGLIGPKLFPIPAAWTSILFRSRIREEIGLIDPEAGPYADGGFVMHAAARFPFVSVPVAGAILTSHPSSTSATVKTIDGEWLNWWENIIRRLERDEGISLAARTRLRTKEVRDFALFNFERIAFQQNLTAIYNGDLHKARKAAQGVKECGYLWTSRFLMVIVRLECWTRLVSQILKVIKQLRNMKQSEHFEKLNLKYEMELAAVERLNLLAGIKKDCSESKGLL